MHLILLIQKLFHEHHATGSPLSNALHTRYQIEKGTTKAKTPTIPKSNENPMKASTGLLPTSLKKEKRKCPPRRFGTIKVYPKPQNEKIAVKKGCRLAKKGSESELVGGAKGCSLYGFGLSMSRMRANSLRRYAKSSLLTEFLLIVAWIRLLSTVCPHNPNSVRPP
jgi:hypothetical protein